MVIYIVISINQTIIYTQTIINKMENDKLANKENVIIGTHSDRFHLDEVLAVKMFEYYLENKNIEIIRTRNPQDFDNCDILVDVGRIYDPVNFRFDHHQKSCDEKFDEYCDVPLSSAGMVYKHIGRYIIEKFIHIIFGDKVDKISDFDGFVEYNYATFYHKFIKPIDANDNGYSNIRNEYNDKNIFKFHDSLNLPTQVSMFNSYDVNNYDEQMINFKKAGEHVWTIFELYLKNTLIKSFDYNLEAPKVEEYFNERKYSNILVMETSCNSWRQHLSKLDENNEILFTVYPRNEESWGFSTMQRIKFVNDVDLISEKEAEEYFNDIVFIHSKLFCGAAKTKQTAIDICNKSLEIYYKKEEEKRQKELREKKKRLKIYMGGIGIFGLGLGAVATAATLDLSNKYKYFIDYMTQSE